MILPAALFSSESWILENKVKNRMDAAEMSCLGTSKKLEGKQQFCGGLDISKEWRERLGKKIYRMDVKGNREEVD